VPRFPIVGVGASAGGVEALEALFRPMPAEPGMAFVVIIHLGPKHESMLAEIIARYTAMPVHPIRDGDAVAINHIYVLRHEASLTITGGRLRLIEPAATRRERNPIDIFFSALAEDQGEAAIGIVLSGGGSDGTLGVKAIKERGGLTLAQVTDRNIAPQFSSMPSTAIATSVGMGLSPPSPAKMMAVRQHTGRSARSCSTRLVMISPTTRSQHFYAEYSGASASCS
jgi:two-component system, chemotaxis family, CheB/CheR fusion protein